MSRTFRSLAREPFYLFLVAVLLWTGALLSSALPAAAQDGPTLEPPRVPTSDESPISPVRRIERLELPTVTKAGEGAAAEGNQDGGQEGGGQGDDPPPATGFRTIDGSGNNLSVPTIGAAHTHLLRLMPADYADGIAEMAGENRPSARAISNRVSAQSSDIPNAMDVTDYLWQWGQFLDHDIDLTDGADPAEPADIAIPTGDAWFDPAATGEAVFPFNRSLYDPETGTDIDSPRQQVNEITAWIDASNVYGSDNERAQALRTLDGTGRLKTSEGDLLPFNLDGLANAGGPSPSLFLAGDVRANEQAGLAAMHTLWVREHNRLADVIAANNPELPGNAIYQRARRRVGALMQAITYNEFLPALLGPDALPRYRGYRPEVDASIANIFSTAAYRFGHSTLSPTILRLDGQMDEVDEGHLPLRDAFFAPQRLVDEGGIDPILRGLASQACQAVDPFVVDDLRNFLFGPPGSGGFDLVSLNIQRGRDHGLPSYNETREAFGLAPANFFFQITSDPDLTRSLRQAYGTPDAVDLWVGGLAEDRRPGAMVGELWFRILSEQFAALRDGDRYWYERSFSDQEVERINDTTLADVIRRNTDIGDELQDDVFHMANNGGGGNGGGGNGGGGNGGGGNGGGGNGGGGN